MTKLPDVSEKKLDGMTPFIIADELVPKMESALEKATAIDEVNDVRARIASVVTYLQRRLPRDMKDRARVFKACNKSNRVYLESCMLAGRMWATTEKYNGRPPKDDQESLPGIDKSVTAETLMTAVEAGFVDRMDARRCEKASLLNSQDVELYFSECDTNGRQYTLTGLASAFDLLNPKGGGEDVQFTTRSIRARLKGLADKCDALLPHLEGDAIALVEDAADKLRDAWELMAE